MSELIIMIIVIVGNEHILLMARDRKCTTSLINVAARGQ
jgi:hypothetical protein